MQLRTQVLAARGTDESGGKPARGTPADVQRKQAHEAGDDHAKRLTTLELEENLAAFEDTRLSDIERALQKIADGTYGLSDSSGAPIAIERLEAQPEARYTLEEQNARDARRAVGVRSRPMAASTERAILAGGCFWGMQDLLRRYPGIISTRVGYSGGDVPDATYRNHGTHAEAIEITFDPKVISYRRLLEFFFQIQRADDARTVRGAGIAGLSYRSADFHTSPEQKRSAEDTIAGRRRGLGIAGPERSSRRAGTRRGFLEAEPEHQDYLERYPEGYTCHFVRPEWRSCTGEACARDGLVPRRGARRAALQCGEIILRRALKRVPRRDGLVLRRAARCRPVRVEQKSTSLH